MTSSGAKSKLNLGHDYSDSDAGASFLIVLSSYLVGAYMKRSFLKQLAKLMLKQKQIRLKCKYKIDLQEFDQNCAPLISQVQLKNYNLLGLVSNSSFYE